jgi:predicted nucleic acid-binding protein
VVDFVIDASAALAGMFSDERTEAALHILERLVDEHAVAPTFFPFEIANGLAAGARRGRLTAEAGQQALLTIARFGIELIPIGDEALANTVMPLAREHRLSVYDAAYLHLAKTLAIPLATRDGRLRSAAERENRLLSD